MSGTCYRYDQQDLLNSDRKWKLTMNVRGGVLTWFRSSKSIVVHRAIRSGRQIECFSDVRRQSELYIGKNRECRIGYLIEKRKPNQLLQEQVR